MKNQNLKKGQKAVFNYDRSYMTDQRTRNHDNELVTVTSDIFQSNGLDFVSVENEHHAIYPAMVQELKPMALLLLLCFFSFLFPACKDDAADMEGSVTFYSLTGSHGNLMLSVEGEYRGTLTQYYPQGWPECGDNTPAAITVTLPEGTYKYGAIADDGYLTSGSVTVKAGCTKKGIL